MNLSDFDFHLPKELIAQRPTESRDGSRLLVSKNGATVNTNFLNIVDFIQKGDLLIFNDSKVINTRFSFNDNNTGKVINLNITDHISDNRYKAFAKNTKRLTQGYTHRFSNDTELKITAIKDMGEIEVEITSKDIGDFFARYGAICLPPYIRKGIADYSDTERYQTIYARNPGSTAAPTAGLHFTNDIITRLSDNGVDMDFVTLHVGSGTFLPVKVENISEHKMHHEKYSISSNTVEKIIHAKRDGRRVIAVGTTVTRVLESIWINQKPEKLSGSTNIFIKPGFNFNIVDAMITNFHLPKSTLLMLVSAFAGHDNIMKMYHSAIESNFRFFSYGDAMMIERLR